MSVDALNWAKHSTAGARGPKSLLLLLADVSNDHGVLYGGVEWIARTLECSRDTVMRDMHALALKGLVWRIPRSDANGRRTTLTVLAPEGLRGSMRPAGDDPEYGRLIRETPYKRPEPKAPKSQDATSQDAEPQVAECDLAKSQDATHTPSEVTPSVEEEARVRVPSGAHPDLAVVLARLDPAIREGRLTDPQMDGGVRVLDDALLAHGLAVVTAVLDHVVAWLNDPNQRTGRPSHISRMFPTALDKVRQAGRSTAAGDAAGRPAWEDAFERLRSVFFDGREHPLDLLDALAVDEDDLALATLVAQVGTGDWSTIDVALRQGQNTQPGRVAVSKLRKAWPSVVPDRRVVAAALDAADQAVWKRCQLTGVERDQLGVKTPPRRDWGQS